MDTQLWRALGSVSLLRQSLILVQCGQILVHTDAAGVDAMGCGVGRWAWWSMLDSTWAWVAIPSTYF